MPPEMQALSQKKESKREGGREGKNWRNNIHSFPRKIYQASVKGSAPRVIFGGYQTPGWACFCFMFTERRFLQHFNLPSRDALCFP
mmetsp:Transcript_41598/g.82095  ORF Transcript_41598/g.82095 Transcript_41598/m.82095 type:complete len:86 (-) Transcript_41598:1269-1526(-)